MAPTTTATVPVSATTTTPATRRPPRRPPRPRRPRDRHHGARHDDRPGHHRAGDHDHGGVLGTTEPATTAPTTAAPETAPVTTEPPVVADTEQGAVLGATETHKPSRPDRPSRPTAAPCSAPRRPTRLRRHHERVAGVSQLPFTGLDLGLVGGIGALLLIGGFAGRRIATAAQLATPHPPKSPSGHRPVRAGSSALCGRLGAPCRNLSPSIPSLKHARTGPSTSVTIRSRA